MAVDHRAVLELARDGKWDEAHRWVQNAADPLSCLIHGYLHRVEGDLANAQYWYHRAGQSLPDNTLQAEWRRLFDLLSGS